MPHQKVARQQLQALAAEMNPFLTRAFENLECKITKALEVDELRVGQLVLTSRHTGPSNFSHSNETDNLK